MDIIDASRALKEARKLAKDADFSEGSDIRIAVLGSLSIQHFVMLLRYYLAEGGVRAALYEGKFNGIAADALDAASPLYAFAPNAVILLPDWRDIKEWPPLLQEDGTAPLADAFMAGYKQVWAVLSSRLPGVAIFQGNIALPAEAPLGNLEANFGFSRRSYIRKINAALLDAKPSNVNLVDVEHLSSAIGKSTWFDAPQFFLSKMPCRLDNTLWGSVAAEERPDGIACFVANWNDKASNIKSIAARLNIGIESMVFFDDSPAEREAVRRFLPEVEVIDVPDDPALYASG